MCGRGSVYMPTSPLCITILCMHSTLVINFRSAQKVSSVILGFRAVSLLSPTTCPQLDVTNYARRTYYIIIYMYETCPWYTHITGQMKGVTHPLRYILQLYTETWWNNDQLSQIISSKPFKMHGCMYVCSPGCLWVHWCHLKIGLIMAHHFAILLAEVYCYIKIGMTIFRYTFFNTYHNLDVW